jgi:integration host factor subunit alpha
VETLELVLEREARMSITKKDIAKNIKTKALTDNKTSNKLIDSFIEIVKSKSLSNDIKIAHFGTFTNKVTPQRIGRNPKTGDEHIISERVKLNFVVSNKIKEQLN